MIALRSVNPTIHHSVVVPSYFRRYDSVYAVPQVLPNTALSVQWCRIFSELSKEIWCGLLVSLIVSVIIMYFFTKGQRDLIYIALFVAKPLVGSVWSGKFLPGQARIYLAFWLFFCLVVDSSYHCSLLSDLTKPLDEDAIKSLQVLLETKMPIHTSISSIVFDAFYQTNPLYQRLKEKLVFLTSSEFYAMLDAKRSDTAYVINRSDFDVLFINMSYRILPESFIDTFAVPVTMTRPTPYERLFEISILRAISVGALEYTEIAYQKTILQKLMFEKSESKGHKPLSLISLSPVFVLWCAGCVLASLGFITEICYQRFSRYQKISVRRIKRSR